MQARMKMLQDAPENERLREKQIEEEKRKKYVRQFDFSKI